MVDHIFPLLSKFKSIILRLNWPSKDRIKNIESPFLFLNGQKDEIVPSKHTKLLHDAAVKSSYK